MAPPKFARVATRAARAALTCAAYRVLIVICAHADKDLVAFPSTRTIGNETGLDRRSVQRAIWELVEAGLINIRPGKRGANNTFIVLLDEVAGVDPPQVAGDMSPGGGPHVAKVAGAHPPKQTLTDQVTRARAREGRRSGAPSRAPIPVQGDPDADNAQLAELRRRAFRNRGVWLPDWGDRPPAPAAAA
jgi:DNA-binding transcriptional MocR family regulator